MLRLRKKLCSDCLQVKTVFYGVFSGFQILIIRRRDHIGLPIKKHVDVTILSPEGIILNEARSRDYYIPRDIIGRFEELQRFTVSFPNVPPQGCGTRYC